MAMSEYDMRRNYGPRQPQRRPLTRPDTGGKGPGSLPAGDKANSTVQETTQGQRDALAVIRSVLAEYGLESLSQWAWDQLVGGLSMNEILISMRDRPEFRQRFRAIEERRSAGLTPISPAEVVAYERQASQMMRAAGLPEGFYDQPDDFVRFLAGDVALPELQNRVDLARTAAFEAPAEVKVELQRMYGVNEGDLTAFFLDEKRALPLLQQRYVAAQTSGVAQRTGFGALETFEAERIAALGVSEQEAEQGFGALVRGKELFGVLPGSREGNISRDEQLSAVFNKDERATQRIERRARSRVAGFSGGGSFATDRSGFAGVDSANR